MYAAMEDELVVGTGTMKFKVLSQSGDDRVVWDKTILKQIKEARDKFYEYIDKKYLAFSVSENGKQKEKLFRFDPNAEEIIFVPPVVGG